VLSGASWDEPSTHKAAGIIGKAALDQPVLVLVSNDEINALKSFRNLTGTRALAIGDAEVQDYVWAKSLLFTEAAVSFLEGGLTDGGEA
jgi:ribosomal protein L4